MAGLEQIAEMEYPGRMIIIGRDVSGESNVVVYAITGRSAPSRARKLEFEENNEYTEKILEFNSETMAVASYSQPGAAIVVKPTDEEVLKKGNPDLLVYEAMIISILGIEVSNGKQTKSIGEKKAAYESGRVEKTGTIVLADAFREWQYEPDAPNYTPRIGGYLSRKQDSASLAIIKKGKKEFSEKHFFEFPLVEGQGKMIATYTGVNQNPLPSFTGEPLDVKLEGRTPKEVAEAVYEALGPKEPGKDFRVAVAAVFDSKEDCETGKLRYHIINRCEVE